MRLTVLTMPAALLLFLCIACHNADVKKEALNQNALAKSEDLIAADTMAVSAGTAYEFKQAAPENAGGKDKNRQPPPPPQTPVPNPDWDKKIVKTADLNLEVKNFRKFTDRLHQTVKQSGGYIAQEQLAQSASTIENTVMIKVPVDKFDDLLSEMPSDSEKIQARTIHSEDVTGELVDTRSRLETKKEVRQRYLELLRQAKSTKDILAVQEVIDGLQEEMDAASGRIAYLGHAAALSTINLKFYQVLDATVLNDPSPSFLHKIKDAVSEGWAWMSQLVVELVSIWPLLLLGGIGWIYLRKRLHLARRRTEPAVEKH